MKELQIEKILYQWSNPYGIWVVLKAKRMQQRIPICIGQYEGAAILRGLEEVNLPRPWTHDLLATALDELGAEVKHIVLTEWREENQTFYASIVVESNGTTHSIDARPSDALALAVRKKVPILAEDSLFKIGAKAKPEKGAKAKAKGAKAGIKAVPPFATLWPGEKNGAPEPNNKQKKKTTKRA